MDESGNWQELLEEKQNLVITGMVIKDNQTFEKLKKEFQTFLSKHNLKYIHMNELNLDQKQELNIIVDRCLDFENLKVFAYVVNPKIFISQTIKDSDEIYIETSAELISELCFGDTNIDIEYDMKFHYAYAENVVSMVEKRELLDRDFYQMKQNCILNPAKKTENKLRVKRMFSKNLNSYIKKLDNDRFLYDYLWYEFISKVQEGAIKKERFKEKISTLLSNRYKLFNLDLNSDIKIEYKGKNQQSFGIAMVDIVSNIIWNFYNKEIDNDVLKRILEKVKIKTKGIK